MGTFSLKNLGGLVLFGISLQPLVGLSDNPIPVFVNTDGYGQELQGSFQDSTLLERKGFDVEDNNCSRIPCALGLYVMVDVSYINQQYKANIEFLDGRDVLAKQQVTSSSPAALRSKVTQIIPTVYTKGIQMKSVVLSTPTVEVNDLFDEQPKMAKSKKNLRRKKQTETGKKNKPSKKKARRSRVTDEEKLNRKRFQVHVTTGLSSGPWDNKYYGRIAKSNIDLSVMDLYSWQNQQTTITPDVRFGLSYLINETLNFGFEYSLKTVQTNLDIHSFVIGQFSATPPTQTYNNFLDSYSIYVGWNKPIKQFTGSMRFEIESINYEPLSFDFGGEPYPSFDNNSQLRIGLTPGLTIPTKIELGKNLISIYTGISIGYLVSSSEPSVIQQNAGILSVDLDSDDVAKVTPPNRVSPYTQGLRIGMKW